MMMRLFDLIKQYDIITLFRHQAADCDALGSQFGLKQWIQETYPEKQVYALGESLGSHGKDFPAIDVVDDDIIKQSLAVILDTANAIRIDDARWQTAAYKIKIDHHIFVEQYADWEWIVDTKGATCEILADLFQKRGEKLSKQCAEYLYSGLISDTVQFSIAATTPDMLRTAAYLVEQGVDVAKVNAMNFAKDIRDFQLENHIRSHFQLQGEHVAYCILSKADYEAFHLTFNEAKEKVYALGGVNEFYTWALFVENGADEHGNPLYNGSLRSRNLFINDIATRFGGGGHRRACGVKHLSRNDIDAILQAMEAKCKEQAASS